MSEHIKPHKLGGHNFYVDPDRSNAYCDIYTSQDLAVPEFFPYDRLDVLVTSQEPLNWMLDNPILFPGDLLPINSDPKRKTILHTYFLYLVLQHRHLFSNGDHLTGAMVRKRDGKFKDLRNLMVNANLISEGYYSLDESPQEKKKSHDLYEVCQRICAYITRFPRLEEYLNKYWLGKEHLDLCFYPTGEPAIQNCTKLQTLTYGAYRQKKDDDGLKIEKDGELLFPLVMILVVSSGK